MLRHIGDIIDNNQIAVAIRVVKLSKKNSIR
jgi:hypothetical protein